MLQNDTSTPENQNEVPQIMPGPVVSTVAPWWDDCWADDTEVIDESTDIGRADETTASSSDQTQRTDQNSVTDAPEKNPEPIPDVSGIPIVNTERDGSTCTHSCQVHCPMSTAGNPAAAPSTTQPTPLGHHTHARLIQSTCQRADPRCLTNSNAPDQARPPPPAPNHRMTVLTKRTFEEQGRRKDETVGRIPNTNPWNNWGPPRPAAQQSRTFPEQCWKGFMEIQVPSDQMGRVFGKYGQNLNRIQRTYRVLVERTPLASSSSASQVMLIIRSPNRQDCIDASHDILDNLPINLKGRCSTKVRVLSEHVGWVVGKGGQNVKRIEQNYRVRVQLPDQPAVLVRPVDVELTIWGSNKQDCEDAAKYILDNQLFAVQGDVSAEVQVPTKCLGWILGKSGKNIRRIERQYRVKVSNSSTEGDHPVNTKLIIWGSNKQDCDDAAKDILDDLSKEDDISTEVQVPAECFGWVVGKGGHNLHRMEKQFRVRITPPPQTTGDRPVDATFVIRGSNQRDCEEAAREILDNLPDTLMIPVDQKHIPLIIFNAERIIQNVQDLSNPGRVLISAPREGCNHPGQLKIQGPAKRCKAVRREVLALIDAAELSQAQPMTPKWLGSSY